MIQLRERVITDSGVTAYPPDIAVGWSPREVPLMFVESWAIFAHFYGQNAYNLEALADMRDWTGFSAEEIREQMGEQKVIAHNDIPEWLRGFLKDTEVKASWTVKKEGRNTLYAVEIYGLRQCESGGEVKKNVGFLFSYDRFTDTDNSKLLKIEILEQDRAFNGDLCTRLVTVDYKGINDRRALYQQTDEMIEGIPVWRVFTIDYLRPPQRLSTHASINTALDEYRVYSDLSISPSTYFTSFDNGRRVFEDRMRQYPLPYAEPFDFEHMLDIDNKSGMTYPVNYIIEFSPPDGELMAKAIV